MLRFISLLSRMFATTGETKQAINNKAMCVTKGRRIEQRKIFAM